MIKRLLLAGLVVISALTAGAMSGRPAGHGPAYPEQKLVSPTGERVDMGQAFAADRRRYEREAALIIKEARSYREGEKRLTELQRAAHHSWKGHGPEFLDKYLQKLARKNFR